ADPAGWRGLLLLAATAGGRVHVLETRSAGRLRTFLASGTLSRMTVGRVVFDRRRDGLYLYRECRDIAPLALPAGAAGVWDGRFRLVNGTRRTIIVSAAGQVAVEGLQGPALRAHHAAPCLKFEDGAPLGAGMVDIAPVIAPYARFLPRFDLPAAQALAQLAGCPSFASPPNE
ncbi:MAG: tRNA lysidine(34) synthetase TilS, partial [Shinella sp.]